ncbi:MAG: hypothetical protein ACTHKS_12410 [Gaiellaceae bacterium]
MPDDRPPATYFGAPPRSFDRVASRLRMFAGFVVRLGVAWVQAGRELVALLVERHRLGRSRRTLQFELGAAALAEDEQLVADLRERLRACLDEQERIDRKKRVAVARAWSETIDERAAIAPTEIRRAE